MPTATRAIDGNLDQHWLGGSVTHTSGDEEDLDPWWELSLDEAKEVQHVRIFNRNDCCGSRLSNAILELYNDEGERTYRHNLGAAEDIKEVRLGESYNVKRVKIQVSKEYHLTFDVVRFVICFPHLPHASLAVAWLQGTVIGRSSTLWTYPAPSRA